MSTVIYDTPSLAEKYDAVGNSQFGHGQLLVKELNIKAGDHVLDIGCGTGRLAEYILDIVGNNGHVYGIDPAEYRIQIAQQKIKGKSLDNISFKVGKGEDLSAFADNSFDAVTLNMVFHWITDKKLALKEIHRVLKQGGRVGLTTGDKDNPFTLKQITDRLFQQYPYAGEVNIENEPSKQVAKKELHDLFKATGFQDVNITNKNTRRYFPTPQKVIEWVESSSFGNFLIHVPVHLRTAARHDIEKELEKKRTPKGIELVSNPVFAIAGKP